MRPEIRPPNPASAVPPARIACFAMGRATARPTGLQEVWVSAMATASSQLHESAELLRPLTIDRHRATVSLMEELEAADWYDQRVEAASDPELAEVLRHNRDEEKEHAAM